MKPINIVTGNHGESPVHVEDIITYLASALQSGGLEVNIIPHLVYAEAHIIIECFDNFTADSILLCISTGARFILVVTEYITGNTFNDFSVDASDSEDRQYWNFRYKNFRRVADKCQAIWCLSEMTYKNCTSLYGSKVSIIPFAYVEGYAKVTQRADNHKDIDFLFTGSITPRRSGILDQLKEAGFSVQHFSPYLPSYIRENIISRSKISLAIAQSQNWIYKSEGRIYYHLMNQSFIAQELLEVSSPLDPYCEIIPREIYWETARDILKAGTYSELARANLERFIDERPLRSQLVDILKHDLERKPNARNQ
jgi:hypothetical protein